MVSIFFLFVVTSCSLFWPLIFSYFADITTDRVANIGENTYNCGWYYFPTQLQRPLILIIARSQDEILFSGLGVFDCNLKKFGNVCSI